MRGMKTEIIPVVIGTLGSSRRDWKNTHKKSLGQSTSMNYKK